MITFLKTLHISCAAFSFIGFAIRGWWMWRDSPYLGHKLTRTLPHIVDSLLLLSAISLIIVYGISPFQHPWLISKISALVLYILLGTIALKRGKTKPIRLTALVLALICYGHILSSAINKSPWGYFSWIY